MKILMLLRCSIKQRYLLFIIYFAGTLLFPAYLHAKESEKAVYMDYPYAINLQSTIGPLDRKSIPNLLLFKDYRLYTTLVTLNGQSWTRLRLGFFKTKQNALVVHKKLVKHFPEAWVTIVGEQERESSIKTAIAFNGRILPDKVSVQDNTDASMDVDTDDNKLLNLSPLPLISSKNTPSVTSSAIEAAAPASTPSPEVKDILAETNPVSQTAIIAPISISKNTDTDSQNINNTSSKNEILLEQARTAFTAGEYQKTIQLTTAILEMPASKESKDALELLGVARERNGQIAHAKAEYEKYLTLYPDGEDAKRVSQRLAGLVTAASKPTSLASASSTKGKKTIKPTGWQSIGSFSQYYYRDERSIDEEDNMVDLSSLISTFDMRSRKRTEDYDHRFQITADHAYDFLDNESEGRFSRLFYEIINRENNNNFKIGRQTYSEGGVLGLFDGAVLGLGVTQKSKINAAAGYLLDIEDLLDFNYTKDRKFASVSVDVGNEFKDWDISFYFIQQMVDSIVDRQAVGGEIRYFKSTFNIFNLIDYDTSYNDLNIFLLNANWLFPQQGTFFTTIDIRKVPYLSTSNALQGQPVQTMNELLEVFSEEEVRQLAQDRTATSNTFTIGGSKQLNGFMKGRGQYQVSGDVTYNTISDMPASGGVPVLPGTGDNYFVGGQFIGSSIIKRGDTSILSLRLGFTEISDDLTLTFDTRYPITEKFRFNPRIQYFRREGTENDNLLTTLRLSIKADYRLINRMLVEGEVGYDKTDDQLGNIVTKSESVFGYIGYRLDF
jgi:tetratricopeptide (TPR) repeat protein